MSINTFSSLKASGQKTLDKLTAEIAKIQDKGSQSKEDNRYWKPTVDKAGNGSATIRFLPAPPGEDLPFIRYWDHGFQGPSGKWYIEKSLTTLGKEDPVSEYNSELWAVSTDDNSPTRKQARAQKRRLHFVANIYVVKDPGNPDNEGQVFLYEFGKKIFDKINYQMNPEFDDETPMNPFNLWEGADFKLKIRKVDGYQNYDKSEFADPAPLSDDDDELEKIWKSEHSLNAVLDPANFKSYDELKKKLNAVLGLTEAASRSLPEKESAPLRTREAEVQSKEQSPPWNSGDDEDEEDENYFKKLRSSLED